MAMIVNTNLSSLNATNHGTSAAKKLQEELAKLSSGKKINKAADDAAGLALAAMLTSDEGAMREATRNVNDGISMLQAADGQAANISEIYGRMKELAVAASSETVDPNSRAALEAEFAQLNQEAMRISQQQLPIGDASSDPNVTLQAGIDSSASSQISVDLSTGAPTSGNVMLPGVNLSSASNALGALDSIDSGLQGLNARRSTWGAAQNRLVSSLENLTTARENTTAAASRIQDTDFAQTTAELARAQLLGQSSLAALSHSNLNTRASLRLIGG